MTGIKIIGTGCYLPERIVTNEDFEKIVDTSDEWIRKRTGIGKRHLSDGEYTWQMGLKAAKMAIKDAGVSPEAIDMIIATTVSADFAFASMSNVIQGKLGAVNAFGIDISCACAGFVYGLDMAQRYIAVGEDVQTVLIISPENVTKTVDYTDRSTCVLFGDGAGAVVVTKGKHRLFSYLGTDGTGAELIYSHHRPPSNYFADSERAKEYQSEFPNGNGHWMHMEGREVYKFAVVKMPYAVEQACLRAGVAPRDLTWVIPHQANIRIIQTAAKNLGLPMEKMYINIEEIGNISSACIPVCLHQLRKSGRLREGDKIAIVGFGAGLTYGAAVITIEE